MRLLLVTHYMPPHHGGIERIAEDHARVAAKAGIDVTWVASREPAISALDERLAWGRAVRIPTWNALERRLGVPYPLWPPSARGRIGELVAAADLVHVHDVLYPGTRLALAAARAQGKPSLLTQHIGFVPYPSRMLRLVQTLAYRSRGRRSLAQATAVAVYSDTAREWLERACGLSRPPIELPNPVDLDLFRPPADAAERRELRVRHRLPVDRPLVMFAGRLVAKKGAAALVAARESDWHLLLVGERGQVALPEGTGVELRPFVARETLAEFLRAADVFALPSRGEGFPLVAQEAMASGLPVVLGEDPGIARQIDPGAAILVAPEPHAIRAAIRGLLDRPAEAAAMGRLARASTERRFATAACHARLLAIYADLVATGRACRSFPRGGGGLQGVPSGG